MSHIQEALVRLSGDLPEFRESFLWGQIEATPYIAHLKRTVDALEIKFDSGSRPKPPLDPEEVWAKWRTAGYELAQLDSREVRTLCVSPATAMRPRLIQALTKSPDSLKRLTTFSGFVQAYFGQWRTMADPEWAERLIQRMLEQGRIPRKSRVLEVWRRSLYLFTAEASKRIGQVVIRDRRAVKQVCAECFIDGSAPVAIDAHEQATSQAVGELIQWDVRIGQESALKELQWISSTLLTNALSGDAYRLAMGKLIVSRLAESMPLFQSAIVDLVHADERMGDPRLAHCAPNWRSVSKEAKERFLAWLAKETLQFFFETLVPRNDENRRRANFWLEYAKQQGKIKDFQVAVSDEDRPKVLASRTKTIPSYSRVTMGKTSAFLMVFEGYGAEYVVIEFSETGNAAYIYSRKAFESGGVKLRSHSFHLRDDLKRMDDAHERILHLTETRQRWEVKAKRILAELGIRP